MKRSIALLLAVLLLLAAVPPGVYADDAAAEVRYGYRTQTLQYTDKSNAAAGLTAALSMPYYMGTVNAVLNTRLGEAESKVMVLYVPDDKWDGDCLYGALSARLTPYGISVLPGRDLVIGYAGRAVQLRQRHDGDALYRRSGFVHRRCGDPCLRGSGR